MKPSQNIAIMSLLFFVIEGGYVLLYEMNSRHRSLYAVIIIIAFIISGELSVLLRKIERNRAWLESRSGLEGQLITEMPEALEESHEI